MARARNDSRFEAPKGLPTMTFRGVYKNDRFGRFTEAIARGMGTPWFLLLLTLFVVLWMIWNTIAEQRGWFRLDSAVIGFTVLTLILSLQASYAAPLILLAQNRQEERDRAQTERDREQAARVQADTEFLTREAVDDVVSRLPAAVSVR